MITVVQHLGVDLGQGYLVIAFGGYSSAQDIPQHVLSRGTIVDALKPVTH